MSRYKLANHVLLSLQTEPGFGLLLGRNSIIADVFHEPPSNINAGLCLKGLLRAKDFVNGLKPQCHTFDCEAPYRPCRYRHWRNLRPPCRIAYALLTSGLPCRRRRHLAAHPVGRPSIRGARRAAATAGAGSGLRLHGRHRRRRSHALDRLFGQIPANAGSEVDHADDGHERLCEPMVSSAAAQRPSRQRGCRARGQGLRGGQLPSGQRRRGAQFRRASDPAGQRRLLG